LQHMKLSTALHETAATAAAEAEQQWCPHHSQQHQRFYAAEKQQIEWCKQIHWCYRLLTSEEPARPLDHVPLDVSAKC
jgi:hypothetical protein